MGKDEKLLSISSPFFLIYLGIFMLMPFSIFIIPDIDMWVANGLFFQVGVFILYLISFFEKEKNDPLASNKPLLGLSAWVLGSTVLVFHESAMQKFYNQYAIFGFINFLTFLMFYRLSVEFMTRDRLKKLLNYFSYSVCLLIIYCILQKFNLDQFQHPTVEPEGLGARDFLVGTIGNPTHLASYIAILLPIFYMKESKRNFIFSCLSWLVIGWTGSASGLLTAIVVTIFYGLFFKLRMIATLIIGIVMYAIFFMSRGFDIHRILVTYMNPEGRYVMWGRIFEMWKLRPLVGYGMGYLVFFKTLDKTVWEHAHNELLQVALELGLLGVILVLYCLIDYFRTFLQVLKTEVNVAIAAMFVGFVVSSFLNFTAHLWLISSLGMLTYSSMYLIHQEELVAYDV